MRAEFKSWSLLVIGEFILSHFELRPIDVRDLLTKIVKWFVRYLLRFICYLNLLLNRTDVGSVKLMPYLYWMAAKCRDLAPRNKAWRREHVTWRREKILGAPSAKTLGVPKKEMPSNYAKLHMTQLGHLGKRAPLWWSRNSKAKLRKTIYNKR